ncbi:hypothetical protein K439DRAFT_1408071 [Ramaria rubella]|nr:hypothetical protein K439DRAFT_1408071 [Ramaria rubella]
MSTIPLGPPGFPSFIPPPLPPGWTEHQAPGGQTYYHHAATNQSTYTRPLPGFPVPGGIPFMGPGAAVIPGAAPPKEKKKKERPLVKTPIPGTPWLRVKTTEGNVFWTHKERKESVWVVPDEIKEAVEKMEQEEKDKEERVTLEKAQKEEEDRRQEEEETNRKEREEVVRVMEEVKSAVAAGKRKASEPAEEPEKVEHKKARVEDEVEEENDEEWQREVAEKMAVEAEDNVSAVDAEHDLPSNVKDTAQDSPSPGQMNSGKASFKVPDRVDLSIEEAKALFKTLLQDKNINPLHPWDTSLPLFISDPRYVLLPSVSARREAFDEYCRDAARAQRAAKAAALKEEAERTASLFDGEKDKDKEAYSRLLREEVTSTRATWHDFRRKWKKDRRFFGWAGDKERERAFRDWLRTVADTKKTQAEKAEREFFQLLREHKEIKPGDVWKDAKRKIDPKDPRYDAVGSSSLREELFATYVKTVRETVDSGNIPTPPKDVDSTRDDHADADAARRKQRAERAERGLREREEKVRRDRAGLERELGRTRGAVGREEGEREFMTLLTDAIRDPQATWDAAVVSLSRDPRFVLCALPLPVQRDLFFKHIARLRDKYLTGLHALFAAHAPRLATRWQDLDENARNAVQSSVPVGKLGLLNSESNSDDGRGGSDALETEFERWQRTRNTEARQAFDIMLGENAFLEFWGRMGKVGGEGLGDGVPDEEEEEEGEEGGGRADLKKLAKAIDKGEVEKVLKGDSRWTAFDHVPQQRERWLREYMERLAAPKLSVHVPEKDKA